MGIYNKLLGALVVAGSVMGTSVPANAQLITTIDGSFGTVTQTNPLNTFNLTWLVPGAGFINTSFTGQSMLSGGSLMDISLDSAGIAAYTVTFTQTNINLSGSGVFSTLFSSNNIGSGVVVNRQVFLDPLDTGLQSILLTSSVVGAGLSSVELQSAAQLISGPFSLTERIQVSGANPPGRTVSLDDTVHVPEPGIYGLLLAALLSLCGLGFMRRRRSA